MQITMHSLWGLQYVVNYLCLIFWKTFRRFTSKLSVAPSSLLIRLRLKSNSLSTTFKQFLRTLYYNQNPWFMRSRMSDIFSVQWDGAHHETFSRTPWNRSWVSDNEIAHWILHHNNKLDQDVPQSPSIYIDIRY